MIVDPDFDTGASVVNSSKPEGSVNETTFGVGVLVRDQHVAPQTQRRLSGYLTFVR